MDRLNGLSKGSPKTVLDLKKGDNLGLELHPK
jgi:hypothetical protein